MLFPCFQICGTMRLFARSKRLQVSFRTDSTPNPSSRRWQSERRHVDQPRQRNCLQVLQGGYPPEGPHCAAEVLRAEAKTAGSNQRICRLRIYSAAPLVGAPAGAQRSGSGGEKEGQRSAMQFSALAGNGMERISPRRGVRARRPGDLWLLSITGK